MDTYLISRKQEKQISVLSEILCVSPYSITHAVLVEGLRDYDFTPNSMALHPMTWRLNEWENYIKIK